MRQDLREACSLCRRTTGDSSCALVGGVAVRSAALPAHVSHEVEQCQERHERMQCPRPLLPRLPLWLPYPLNGSNEARLPSISQYVAR